jgi:alcohol dehydrogenase
MRELILSAPGQLRWTEARAPELSGPHGALVEPIAVATCDFDHLLVSGRQPAAWPLAIGHEFVARVLQVGDEVRSFTPGDVVIVPFQISCGSCAACERGQTSACARVPWLSCYGLGALAGNWGGAASDVVSVPYADAMLVRLPAGLAPHDAAAVSCNVVDAYRTVGPQLAARRQARVHARRLRRARIRCLRSLLTRAPAAGYRARACAS